MLYNQPYIMTVSFFKTTTATIFSLLIMHPLYTFLGQQTPLARGQILCMPPLLWCSISDCGEGEKCWVSLWNHIWCANFHSETELIFVGVIHKAKAGVLLPPKLIAAVLHFNFTVVLRIYPVYGVIYKLFKLSEGCIKLFCMHRCMMA